jgi:hypothetical protein
MRKDALAALVAPVIALVCIALGPLPSGAG